MLSKKIFYTFLFSLSLLFFAGCEFDYEDDKDNEIVVLKDNKPSVSSQGSQITVSIKAVNHLKYVSVYRKNVTDADEANHTISQIGIMYPEGYQKEQKQDKPLESLLWQDDYTCIMNKYSYCARFVTDDGDEYLSEWSEKIQAPDNALQASATVAYTVPSDCYFVFDKENGLLTQKGTIAEPTALARVYTPMIALNNGKTTKLFQLVKLQDTYESNLKTILTSDFMNVDLTTVGLVPEIVDKFDYKPNDNPLTESEEIIKRVIWLEPSGAIVIKNAAGTELSSIKVLSPDVESGLDYGAL